jgi:hypothetical protein
MSKGDKNNRVKDWHGYWASFDSIFKKKVDKEVGEWHYDSYQEVWYRTENGKEVWYQDKPEE